ncbi:unnamed protein product [Bursaphelenchus okinawaensis]|uniref:BZIP domain-containing protein n=1 Tax=Bursaphelenchus okinawaensis TaxID=465554 RepID=A0A811LDM6_9BILA|nr:unnamed protein product [Bursaphelenchus okinawaensis]CAG9121969.1 unnamed protein product [Bursaphelenchus okinawaensis]
MEPVQPAEVPEQYQQMYPGGYPMFPSGYYPMYSMMMPGILPQPTQSTTKPGSSLSPPETPESIDESILSQTSQIGRNKTFKSDDERVRYEELRRKNNLAARQSRAKRNKREKEVAVENEVLHQKVKKLQIEMAKIQSELRHYKAEVDQKQASNSRASGADQKF